ncbi:hypothetical protein BH09ACT8_BH09ACT8_40150 [soil metagenome]
MSSGWDRARTIADAVLYEGYLLYPYRASSAKNQSRWQFGVLGPPGAAETAFGEDDTLSAQFCVEGDCATITLVLRFLHLQRRCVEKGTSDGGFEPVNELKTGTSAWLSWDEAVETELTFGPLELGNRGQSWTFQVAAPAAETVETVDGGRLLRSRRTVHGRLTVTCEPDGGLQRLTTVIRNTTAFDGDKDDAIDTSMIGTHLIVEAVDGAFISLLEPPDSATAAVARCCQYRCFPVLAGPPDDHALLLISPIILYDHPEIAEQSEGALYDSTEIDEILTLRVMTMTDDEKAQARATDPLAGQIIDRCDSMSPQALQRLHGVLRDPHSVDQQGLIPEIPDGVDWWDPLADNAVAPDIDAVLVDGVRVARGSKVLLKPSRRADAQDIFFAGKVATVTSVHETVDGDHQVGVTVDDDPAADLHDWYGRYLYFAPDELEPLQTPESGTERSSTWQQ